MNRLSAFLVVLLVACAFSAPAQSTEDQYVRIYNLIQQADTLSNSGKPTQALPKYLEAQTALKNIQRQNPSWNPKVVNFRLEYLADKIAGLPGVNTPAARPQTAPLPVITTPASPPASATPPVTQPIVSPEPASTVTTLQNEVARLQSEKTILQAKLKEALATQPAAVDPRELVKAQEKIQSLLKENDLLKTSLESEKEKPRTGADAKEIEYLKTALADANRKLTEQLTRANSLLAEQQETQKRLDSLTTNTNELASLKLSLAEANQKLAEQTAATGKLSAERNSLLEKVGLLTASAATADALRAENELLKQQLVQTKATASPGTDETNQRRLEAEAQLAILRSDAQVLRLEKLALESRLQKTAVAKPAGTGVSNEAAAQRIRQLEKERDELQGRSGKELVAKVDQLTKEVTGLRARVEVFEARAVPYTAEELALFQPAKSRVVTIDPVAGRRSIRELPAGSAALVAAAQRNFAAKEYNKAEANYLEILRQDERNPSALANLAAIQLEMGRLDQAEKNINQALTTAPDDGYNLSILGYVKFRQEKYDEALDALSRASRSIPQSAEIQNYLGVTLSQKGLRGPAETALRKAIQINPTYGDAHNNLAVIYATQTPPLIELARWHYQKALAAGHPKNPELEKLFDKKEAAEK